MRKIEIEGYGDIDDKLKNYYSARVIKYVSKNNHYKATIEVEDFLE